MSPLDAFTKHRQLALRIASLYLKRLPGHVRRDDVRSAAECGLWDAAMRHHDLPERHFRPLASKRIWGAIGDELRRNDPFKKLRRRKFGTPSNLVYADAYEGTEDVFQQYAYVPDIEADLDASCELRLLTEAARRLPPKHQLVIARTLAGETQIEISRALGVTQARVSQIMSAAVASLREKLQVPTKPR